MTVIDCHAHLDERVLDTDALVGEMDRHGIDRAALIARITETLEPEKSAFLLAAQRAVMNSEILRPVARAAAATFYDGEGRLRAAWRPFTSGGSGYVKTMEPANDSVVRAVRRHPDRLLGWIFVNPRCGVDPLSEIDRLRGIPGMIGVKVHPYWHGYPVHALEPALARAEELGLPLLIHMGFGAQGDYRWLLDRFPRLPIIFAHAGLPYYKTFWRLARRRTNAFVDLSSMHLSESFVRRVVDVLGPAKCLYGTDAPYGFRRPDGTFDYGAIKGWIERLPVSPADRERILGENFRALVRL